ncbi:MAG TPA: lmo0937 family membrane protein [Patescibacteria group bacterium]|nr:lmo0937 family membrane protein [Patescibacteria group bacterium]
MLETIAIILVILWLLGILSSYAVGGFIHLLLVLAVIVVLVRLFGGGPKPPV